MTDSDKQTIITDLKNFNSLNSVRDKAKSAFETDVASFAASTDDNCTYKDEKGVKTCFTADQLKKYVKYKSTSGLLQNLINEFGEVVNLFLLVGDDASISTLLTKMKETYGLDVDSNNEKLGYGTYTSVLDADSKSYKLFIKKYTNSVSITRDNYKYTKVINNSNFTFYHYGNDNTTAHNVAPSSLESLCKINTSSTESTETVENTWVSKAVLQGKVVDSTSDADLVEYVAGTPVKDTTKKTKTTEYTKTVTTKTVTPSFDFANYGIYSVLVANDSKTSLCDDFTSYMSTAAASSTEASSISDKMYLSDFYLLSNFFEKKKLAVKNSGLTYLKDYVSTDKSEADTRIADLTSLYTTIDGYKSESDFS